MLKILNRVSTIITNTIIMENYATTPISGVFVVTDKFSRNYILGGATLGGGVITEIVPGEDGYYVRGTLKEDYENKNEGLLTFIPYSVNPIVEYHVKFKE